MNVVQVCIGRFHHFHLAKHLHSQGSLARIFTGFPWMKVRREGLPKEKVGTYPWLQTPYMAALRYLPRGGGRQLRKHWQWWSHEAIDAHAARNLPPCDVLVGLSGSALRAGRRAQQVGAKYVCDRGSTHIRHQDRILREEHERWGVDWGGVDPRIMDKEEMEYESADLITVPSTTCRRSFEQQGVPASKIRQVPYGANIRRFKPTGSPPDDRFVIVYVGQVSLRKGIPYLLEAFDKFQHPNKELLIIGGEAKDLGDLMPRWSLDRVKFLGRVSNDRLQHYYSTAHVMVLPSIEEGLSLVQGEAIACGCPVIASENTGGSDLFDDGEEGFIVPVRDSNAIAERLTLLADSPELRARMSAAGPRRAQQIGGWSNYGQEYEAMLRDIVRAG